MNCGYQVQQFKLTMKGSAQEAIPRARSRSKSVFPATTATIPRSSSLRRIEHQQQHTFRPKINELPFEIYPQRTKEELSRREMVERLMGDRQQRGEERMAAKARAESQEVASCTFQPTISTHSRLIVGQRVDSTFQRLFAEGAKNKATERTSASIEQDKENCTFRPNISSNHLSAPMQPIYQRLQQIVEERKEAQRRLQQEQVQMLKDTPQINHRSKEINEKRGDLKKNVLDRLMGYVKQRNQRIQRLVDKREQEERSECPFQPAVNQASEPTLLQDFVSRQEQQAERSRQQVEWLRAQNQAPFHPSINPLSDWLTQNERENQTQEEKIQRLHSQPMAQKRAQVERVQAELYHECTFEPEINPLSKEVKPCAKHHDCHSRPNEQHFRFQPTINQKSRRMVRRPQKPSLNQQEQVRMEMEYKEMKECTFRPKTNARKHRAASQAQGVKQVAGFDAYQRRMERKVTRDKEARENQERVFALEKRYKERDHTVAEPFRLSQPQGKIAQIRAEAEEQFQQRHPFHPETASLLR